MAQMAKNLPAIQETWVRSLGQEVVPWRKKWQPTPVFLPGEFYGQRSLAGYSPWGCKSQSRPSDKHFHISTDIMVLGPKQKSTKQDEIVTEERGNKCLSSLDKDERQQLFHHFVLFICCQV